MTRLLHIDSSARSGGSDRQPHGSHSRRLSARFVQRWRELDPDAEVVVRDVGLHPPTPVTGGWIHAAFTPEAKREAWMRDTLAESDRLIDELLAADVIVAGVPMYNFGMPAQFKAWIDNVVRVGRTFGFDRSREGEPYWPLLADAGKRLVLLSSRGDYGYGAGERLEAMNHVEPGVLTPMRYLGITQSHSVAIEYDEFGGERLQASIERAEGEVDALVGRLVGEGEVRAAA
ncbi:MULTISPECIES: FMN-dependent NADH-azoreductase [Lysobacter]|uniref:FMN-dependent NADH-azoreductase n=1 Tax=Lysobacter TaxID=68 RepID=UPI001F21EA34|nr:MULTISPECIES: NAD(P)H-dependent oxidoreductase [Lysobacter]UJB19507.1 NAD(P)H-dependent oxidoreductase [Lysobacter capsici]UJQ26767.1 NAD(P)H-dependent oxidoreductase [Lysobacter gummosus]